MDARANVQSSWYDTPIWMVGGDFYADGSPNIAYTAGYSIGRVDNGYSYARWIIPRKPWRLLTSEEKTQDGRFRWEYNEQLKIGDRLRLQFYQEHHLPRVVLDPRGRHIPPPPCPLAEDYGDMVITRSISSHMRHY